jgi:Au+-exporting ATPase
MNAPLKAVTADNHLCLTLPVEGMTCASCVGRVERVLRAVRGVIEANVNLATERAEIIINYPANRSSLVAAIEKAGYGVPEDPSGYQSRG